MVKTGGRRGKVSFLDAEDIEYTEIKPIRPNQSVILAGLGVQGRKLPAWHKDRGYRSTQGAGYSDGLVLHTARPRTQQGWTAAKEVIFHLSPTAGNNFGTAGNSLVPASERFQNGSPSKSILTSSSGFNHTNGVQTHYDLVYGSGRDPDPGSGSMLEVTEAGGGSRLGREVSWRSPEVQERNWSRNQLMENDENDENLAKDQQEYNEDQFSESRRSRLGRVSVMSGRYRSRSVDRPTYRRSVSVPRSNSRSSSRMTSRLDRSLSRLDRSISELSRSSSRQREVAVQTPGSMYEGSDEELSLLGDSIVRESLNRASNPDVNDSDSDLADLAADLLASDLREDQFTEADYIRSGISPNENVYVERNNRV